MINKFIEVLTEDIIFACHGKRVLLTLTGGLDTRALLSILVKAGIPFDSATHRQPDKYKHKNDVEVAIDLGTMCANRIHYCETLHDISKLPGYDIILTGHTMTEYLCELEFLSKTQAQLDESRKHPGLGFYCPMLSRDVLIAWSNIPKKYLAFSYIQRLIIKKNCPELLQYKTTYYNRKKKYAGFMYRAYLDFKAHL